MNLLRFLFVQSRRTLIIAVIFGFVSGALNSSLLALVNVAISRTAPSLSMLALVFVTLCVLAGVARVISESLLVRLGQDSVLSLRVSLAGQVLNAPLRRLEAVGKHRILSILTDDVPTIANTAGTIPLLCVNSGLVVSCLTYMVWMQWRLAVAVLAFALLGVWTYRLGVSRSQQYFRRGRECNNEMQKHFEGLIHGIKELKMHGQRRHEFLTKLLQGTAVRSREENVAGLTIYSVAASWGQLLVFLVIGLVVFFLGAQVGVDEKVITGFSLALLYLMTPLQMVINAMPGMARSNIAVANIHDIGLKLTGYHDIESASLPARTSYLDAHDFVELSEVAYTYSSENSDDHFTLGPIDLSISRGELLFITGGNGSGKTTLGKLIMGLYTPEAGELRYGASIITDNNRDAYRQLFSVVFSDSFLFESLLGMNPTDLDEQANEYLSALRLDHKVQIQNGMFSTRELSQGQRKRLALLTCYLEDRPIFLFDEWAADQDPVFKEVFYHTILPGLKARGKTVLVISHDVHYYDVADRIITLDSGKLLEQFGPNVAYGIAAPARGQQ